MPKMCGYEYLRYLWTDLSGIKTKMYGKVCTLMWGPKLVCGGAIIGEKYVTLCTHPFNYFLFIYLVKSYHSLIALILLLMFIVFVFFFS